MADSAAIAEGRSIGGGSASPEELARAVAAFNELLGRLHETHDALRAEVARLQQELREANTRLRRSQELAALGEMAAGIAHEVRNPLGSIRLYASMLQRDLDGLPEQQEVAAKIGRAVVGLDRIVGDVLDFSRSLSVTSASIRAEALLRRGLDACAALLGAGAEGVRAFIDANDHDVWCDAPAMHRAIVNVVRNGIEAALAAPAPRWVRLSAARTQLRAPDGGLREATALRVEDSGCGAQPEVIGRMFNPFFTTRATGTGLGLAIVHRIVDAHEGSVRVHNGAHGAIVELVVPDALSGADERQSASKGLDAAMQGSGA